MSKDTGTGNSKVCLMNIKLRKTFPVYLIYVQSRKMYTTPEVPSSARAWAAFQLPHPSDFVHYADCTAICNNSGEQSHLGEMQSTGRIALEHKYGKTPYTSHCGES